jgi:hypothetical protein
MQEDIRLSTGIAGLDDIPILAGMMNSMSEEHGLTMQLHEFLSYLSQIGVASFLVPAQFGLPGHAMSSPRDESNERSIGNCRSRTAGYPSAAR